MKTNVKFAIALLAAVLNSCSGLNVESATISNTGTINVSTTVNSEVVFVDAATNGSSNSLALNVSPDPNTGNSPAASSNVTWFCSTNNATGLTITASRTSFTAISGPLLTTSVQDKVNIYGTCSGFSNGASATFSNNWNSSSHQLASVTTSGAGETVLATSANCKFNLQLTLATPTMTEADAAGDATSTITFTVTVN